MSSVLREIVQYEINQFLIFLIMKSLNIMKRVFAVLLIRVFTFGVLCLLFSCGVRDQTSTLDKEYPAGATRPEFKEVGRDSLEKIMDFDVLVNDADRNVVGFISNINFSEDYIYITDKQQHRVFVLDRETFAYRFSIGEGPGKAPTDLNRPFGLQVLSDKLMIPHGSGQYLASFYTFDGDFIETLTRKLPRQMSTMDNSFLLKGDTVYTTVGIAWDHKKALVFDIYEQEAAEILDVSDFHSTVDTTLDFSKVVPTVFLSASVKDPSIFYAVPGTKPLVNTYDMDGQLQNSYDLRSIPILDTFYNQHKALFHDPASEAGFIFNYFTGVINDGKDYLIFGCQEIGDLGKIGENFEGLGDPENVRNFYVFVNPEDKTYKLFKCEFAAMPMKVIDGNLWCFDMGTSRLIVYRLPN